MKKGGAEKSNLSSSILEERRTAEWTHLPGAISCAREGRKRARARVQEETRAGVISDLQLSPSVSAAKKLPFSLVLSSSMLHVAGS